eukprot:346341_1
MDIFVRKGGHFGRYRIVWYQPNRSDGEQEHELNDIVGKDDLNREGSEIVSRRVVAPGGDSYQNDIVSRSRSYLQGRLIIQGEKEIVSRRVVAPVRDLCQKEIVSRKVVAPGGDSYQNDIVYDIDTWSYKRDDEWCVADSDNNLGVILNMD